MKMSSNDRLLLVEDNTGIAEALEFTLKKSGYEVSVADTIAKADALVYNGGVSLVLLDVMLPDGNGFDFYKKILAPKGIPAIFLTARDEENDIVRGLTMGAEDYITKPFSTKELLARINRVFMRSKRETVLTAADITFDLEKHEVSKNGKKLELSSLELKILRLLFMNHDKAVKRSDVIDLIWQATGNDVYDHTVTVYIKRIKDKLGTDIIKTIKGIGYRIDLSGGSENND
jgi:DNA-binding response OmpR family regulator